MSRGGTRPNAGRKPGAVSKAKRELAEMAKDYAEAALRTLASIMQNDQEPASARVSAAQALLDRGYGKAPQALDVSNKDGTLSRPTEIILKGPDGKGRSGDTAEAD